MSDKKKKKLFKKTLLKEKDPYIKKNSAFYWFMLFVWLGMTAYLWYELSKSFNNLLFYEKFGTVSRSNWRYGLGLFFVILNSIFMSYFWLNGIKDFIYVMTYFIFKKVILRKYYRTLKTNVAGVNDKVLLVYCCCNDFNENALFKSMQQKYHNYDVAILDDSSFLFEKKKVDDFAKNTTLKLLEEKIE